MLASTSVLALIAGVTVPVVQAAPAHANPTEGFEPGNIISDAHFYDGDALTDGQIQNFLDERVPRCTIGDPNRRAGSPAIVGGKVIGIVAQECLRDYRETTQSRAANNYCHAVPAGENELASRIIAKIGRACGISPKVLLVMLAKEQNLIQDTWPTVRQFDFAMGAYCPDTGPGGTANCDPARVGFANQVYYAGFLLKYYQAHNGLNYHPHQTNSIKWSPAAGCGTSQVYIENMATASLYTYTPYRPNAAALAAGWGTSSDRCASYGNRNFYSFYKTWFGEPKGIPVHAQFESYWRANAAWLRGSTAPAKSLSVNGGGLIQSFTGGGVYLSNAPGARVTGIMGTSPIMAAFVSSGSLEGSWGWPLAPAENLGATGNNTLQFQNGLAVEARGVGTNFIPNALVAYWRASGGLAGTLGAPMSAAVTANGAWQQRYQHGTAIRDAAGTARTFDSRFLAAWEAAGGLRGSIGTPVADAVTYTENGGGQIYELSNGVMYRSQAGVFVLPTGNIRDGFDASGGVAGVWGPPVGDYVCDAGASVCTMRFANGMATWSPESALNFFPNEDAVSGEIVPERSRISGADRFATAVAASQYRYESTQSTVIVASGDDFPDALAAAALGAHIKAPLLLTSRNSVPAVTIEEIRRLRPSRVVVVGGPGAVAPAVIALLEGESDEVVRLHGEDRYETSLEVAKYGWTTASDVFVAAGSSFPDALSAGAAAGKLNAPIILIDDRKNVLRSDIESSLVSLLPERIHIAGGKGVITSSLESDLGGVGASEVVRYGGQDRFETSALIANSVFWGQSDVYLATGRDFADALAGAATAGSSGAPLMLAQAGCIPKAVDAAADRLRPAKVVIFGGPAVLSSHVLAGRVCG